MSTSFSYDFKDASGGTDILSVTVGVVSDSTGLGQSYAVTAISGTIDGVPITGEVGSGGMVQPIVSADGNFDNAIFTSATGGQDGSSAGIDFNGLEFTAGGYEYNLFTSNGTFIIADANDFGHQQSLTLESTDAPCFCAGTMILTAQGEVSVEALRPGDQVVTPDGPMPVRAVHRTVFGGSAQRASARVRPVRIAAGALAPQQPTRDLWVSPSHAMFLDGYLVPAYLLLNGNTVTQPARHNAITYFHVELEPHNILFANGAASESYLEVHAVSAGATALFPDATPKSWEEACAPLLLAGPALERIQARLLDRARLTATRSA